MSRYNTASMDDYDDTAAAAATGAGSSATSTNAANLSRVKSLMAQHYGTRGSTLGSNGGGRSTDAATEDEAMDEDEARERARGALDLDSSYFEVDSYVGEQLRATSFPQLLDRDEELVKTIRELDQEMQELVYHNYQKFIGATATMRSMKDKLFQMEAEVQGLESRMDSIALATQRMNERNATKRQSVARLDRLGKLLNKLQDLYELATRLSTTDDLDHLAQAIEFYSLASPFLAKQNNPTFAGIARSSRAALEQVRTRLRTRLERERSNPAGTDPDELARVLDVLVAAMMALGDSSEVAARVFFQWHLNHLAGVAPSSSTSSGKAPMRAPTPDLTASSSSAATAAMATHPSSTSTPALPDGVTDDIETFVVTQVREALFDKLVRVSQRALEFRGWAQDERVTELHVEFAKEVVRLALTRLRARFDAEPSHFRLFSTAAVVATADGASGAENAASAAGGPTPGTGAAPSGAGGTSMAETVLSQRAAASTSLAGLAFATKELVELNARLAPFLVSKLRLGDRASELGERAVRRQITATMSELKRRAEERVLVELPTDENRLESLRREIEDASTGLVADARMARQHLDVLLKDGATFLADMAASFEDLFKFQLQDWCTWLAEILSPAGFAQPAIRVRLLANAAIARNVAARVEQQLRLVDPKAAREAFKTATDESLRAFVAQVGTEAARTTVCRDLDVSQRGSELLESEVAPMAVSSSAVALLDEVGSVSKLLINAAVPVVGGRGGKLGAMETSAAMGSAVGGGGGGVGGAAPPGAYRRGSSTPLRGPSGPSSGVGAAAATATPGGISSKLSGSGTTMRVDMDRLMMDKVAVFADVPFEAEALLVRALMVGLKTWVESVRESVLGTTAFQQLQLDAEFVRRMGPVLAPTGDVASVNKLVMELVATAKERSIHPLSMDPASMDTYCMAKRGVVNVEAWRFPVEVVGGAGASAPGGMRGSSAAAASGSGGGGLGTSASMAGGGGAASRQMRQ